MKISKSFLPFTLLLLLLAACGGDSDGGSDAPQQEEAPPTTTGGTGGGTTGGTTGGGTTGGTTGGGTANFDVVIDSEVTQTERTKLNEGIELIEKMDIDGSRVFGFSNVFGGNKSSNVVSYLEQRVNYITSQTTPPYSRLLVPIPFNMKNLQFYALNFSVDFWYHDIYYSQEGGAQYLISGSPRNINSSRIGVVNLGDSFNSSEPILRAITLVHEARHSDCPGGALLSDVIKVVENIGEISNNRCGQLHNTSGIDVLAWGPYTIGFIYAITVAGSCTNCDEGIRQRALLYANQSQGQAFEIFETLNGENGLPDMSNSTNVRNDL